MPTSRQRLNILADSASSALSPNVMVPMHSGDTRTPVRPKVRYCMWHFLLELSGLDPRPRIAAPGETDRLPLNLISPVVANNGYIGQGNPDRSLAAAKRSNL